MSRSLAGFEGGVVVHGQEIANMRFADGIALITKSEAEPEEITRRFFQWVTLGKGHGGLNNASTKEESERLRGERDQIKLIDLAFERWQVVGLRKARKRQDVP